MSTIIKKINNQKIWCGLYFLRNVLIVLLVFFACVFERGEAVNLLNFISALMIFAIWMSLFSKEKFLNFLKREKSRSQKIVYFARACWWFCIIFFAIHGWIFSAMLWFSAWFIIYNLKNEIKLDT